MSEEQYDDGTGHELAVRHQTSRTVDMRSQATDSWTDVLGDVINLSRGISNTEFVPKGLRGSDAKVTAAILYSRELGLPPLTGLGGVHVIEGSAGISAELMRALILQAGHELAIPEMTREKCVVKGRRKGSEEWTTSTWTMGEANLTQVFLSKEKGWGPISSKAQWKSWPTEMLLARATTRLARMIFPDVVHGMRSVEELTDMTQVETTEQVPEVPKVQRRQTAARQPKEATKAEQEQTAEAPARRTVGRPAPRGRAAAEPQPEPQEEAPKVTTLPEPEPDADGVVDAEIVEPDQAPAKEAPKQGTAAGTAQARKGATQAALMHWKRLDVTDRAERLWYTGVIVGHEVESTNDLELHELRQLVHTLERAKNIDVINALVDSSEKSEG